MSKHLEKALILMKNRPELAAKELRLAIAEDPEDAHLHGLLAACALDYGDKALALQEARLCISGDPSEPLGFQMLAHYYFQENDLLEAEVAIEEAMRLDPFRPSYWGLLANIEIQNGALSQALEAAEHGLSIDPNNVHCHNLRALILVRQGKKETAGKAQDSMDLAMSVDPEDALTHAYRGWTLIEQQKPKESRDHFREALRLDPMLDWARLGLIRSLEMSNWAYTWHKRLKNRWVLVATVLWMIANICLIGKVNEADAFWRMPLTTFNIFSWTLWVGLTSFVFLPYTIVAEPILRFRLQFDPDGKWVLNVDEQRFNKHAIVFLAAALLSVVTGIVTMKWWPLAVTAGIWIATMPIGYPKEVRQKWTIWAGHMAAAAVVYFCVIGVSSGHGSGATIGIVALQMAKYAAFPSLFKAGAGLKILGSAGALKGLGALFGLGGAGALQALKEKEKQKVRQKMFDTSSGKK